MTRRRLARGQPDLALRARDARQRVDEQQDARAAPIAKPLGDRGRDLHGAQAHERRRVARRADHDRARARRRELVAEQLAELAPALADEARTITSALVPRAIWPSSVDLPTPAAANSPMR